MKCQYCKKNEADKVFYVNWMGGIYQIAMCEECMKKMWQKAGAAGQEDTFKKYTGWWPGKPENYEEAARLRDDIAVIEKEVYSHENYTGSV